jgi:hypothetical protein
MEIKKNERRGRRKIKIKERYSLCIEILVVFDFSLQL